MKAFVAAVLADPGFDEALVAIDEAVAGEVQAEGCPHCGGKLDSARYGRVLRHAGRAPTPERRQSFCCRTEGCRRRLTPPSLRFFRHKRYSLLSVLVSVALRDAGPSCGLLRILEREFGVCRSTVRRWLFWIQRFLSTAHDVLIRAVAYPVFDGLGTFHRVLSTYALRADDPLRGVVRFLQLFKALPQWLPGKTVLRPSSMRRNP